MCPSGAGISSYLSGDREMVHQELGMVPVRCFIAIAYDLLPLGLPEQRQIAVVDLQAQNGEASRDDLSP